MFSSVYSAKIDIQMIKHYSFRMSSHIVSACILLLLSSAIAAQTSRQLTREKPAEKRLALVIGNGSYLNAPLQSPVNDANDMALALRSVGFEVILHTDINQAEMKRAVDEFGQKLRELGGTGLFYYAGHGVQMKGKNYLVPIGAVVDTEEDIEYEGVQIGRVLTKMDSAGNASNIVILDASRDNPFARSFRSGGKGLASIDAPSGMFIAFASMPGAAASNGSGRNSPYTEALLKQIRSAELSIEDAFKQVRVSVLEATEQRQTTWESSSLTGSFSFSTNAKPVAAATTPVAPVVEVPVASEPIQTASANELAAWELVKDSSDIEVLQIYLEEFPNGLYSSVARIKVRKIERDEWDLVKNSENAEKLQAHLTKYPKGENAPTARILLRQMEKEAWAEVNESGDPAKLESYLRQYPDGENAAVARIKIKQIEKDAWDAAKDSGDTSKLESYLQQYPEGENAAIARTKIKQIENNAWEEARNSNDTRKLQSFLEAYPEGANSAAALSLIKRLEEENKPEPKQSAFGRLLGGLLESAQVSCKPNANQIALFYDANYKGRCVIRGIGRYSSPRSFGLPDNSISSVIVGRNVRASLCRDSNFRGACESFYSSDANLTNNQIRNDTVSSVVVQASSQRTAGNTRVRTGSGLRPPASGYKFCAKEWGRCTIQGRATVAYGANGKFKYKRNVSGSINCTNQTFGDPAPGNQKACFYKKTSVASARACNPNANQIAIFYDANYRGACVIKNIGTYSSSAAIGLPDNSISSIIVGRNVRASLCRNNNLRGRCETFAASDSSFVNNGIGNDQVSSLRVFRVSR
jgi:hypothetical protein